LTDFSDLVFVKSLEPTNKESSSSQDNNCLLQLIPELQAVNKYSALFS